jgi:phage FluMu protein Com
MSEELITQIEKGCGMRYKELQGFVGRPYIFVCIKDALCPRCKEILAKAKGEVYGKM